MANDQRTPKILEEAKRFGVKINREQIEFVLRYVTARRKELKSKKSREKKQLPIVPLEIIRDAVEEVVGVDLSSSLRFKEYIHARSLYYELTKGYGYTPDEASFLIKKHRTTALYFYKLDYSFDFEYKKYKEENFTKVHEIIENYINENQKQESYDIES